MATNLPPSIPTNIRLPDTRLPQDRRDEAKSKDSKEKDSSLKADNTGLFQRLPDTNETGGGGTNSQGGNQGSGNTGNTQLAAAITSLSGTQIAEVSKDVVNRLTGRTVPEVGDVGANIQGVSTFGSGSLNGGREAWMANFSSLQGQRMTSFSPVSVEDQRLIANGKMEAQLNSGGVNPLVISRDKALGNG